MATDLKVGDPITFARLTYPPGSRKHTVFTAGRVSRLYAGDKFSWVSAETLFDLPIDSGVTYFRLEGLMWIRGLGLEAEAALEASRKLLNEPGAQGVQGARR